MGAGSGPERTAGPRHPLLWGPALLVAVMILLVLGLLLTHHDDPSYSCKHAAIVDLINPEPQGSAAFAADFFDAGRACNRDARIHVAAAGAVLAGGALATGLWLRRRNRGHH